MRATVAAAFAALLAATLPRAARADEPPAAETVDIIMLRTGVALRGRLTEIVPNDHVTIVVEGAPEPPRRIAWSDVDRVRVAAPRGAPAVVPAPAPGSPAPPEGPLVRVRVASPRRIQLYRKGSDRIWVEACSSPCDLSLPVNDVYRVQAGSSRSKDFRLDPRAATAVVDVSPASSGGKALGLTIALAGGATGFIGLLMLFDDDSRTGGLVAAAFGGALTVAGMFIHKGASTTEVTQLPATPPPAAWRAPSFSARAPERPQAAILPIFAHAF